MGKSQKRAHDPRAGEAGFPIGSSGAPDMPANPGRTQSGTGTGKHDDLILPRNAAGYIHDMSIELKDIAESARLSFLAYLLDLVIEESGAQKRGRL